MKDNTFGDVRKNEILQKCFDCLVNMGLERVTTRELCAATGLNPSSLYYWFTGKDDVILSSITFGLNGIIDNLFTDAYKNLNSIDALLTEVPQKVMSYKKHLRLVYQALVSPQYGDRLRDAQEALPIAYNSFTKVLANRLGCEYKRLKPLVQLAISATTNYILWEDGTKLESQFSEIFEKIKSLDISSEK